MACLKAIFCARDARILSDAVTDSLRPHPEKPFHLMRFQRSVLQCGLDRTSRLVRMRTIRKSTLHLRNAGKNRVNRTGVSDRANCAHSRVIDDEESIRSEDLPVSGGVPALSVHRTNLANRTRSARQQVNQRRLASPRPSQYAHRRTLWNFTRQNRQRFFIQSADHVDVGKFLLQRTTNPRNLSFIRHVDFRTHNPRICARIRSKRGKTLHTPKRKGGHERFDN